MSGPVLGAIRPFELLGWVVAPQPVQVVKAQLVQQELGGLHRVEAHAALVEVRFRSGAALSKLGHLWHLPHGNPVLAMVRVLPSPRLSSSRLGLSCFGRSVDHDVCLFQLLLFCRAQLGGWQPLDVVHISKWPRPWRRVSERTECPAWRAQPYAIEHADAYILQDRRPDSIVQDICGRLCGRIYFARDPPQLVQTASKVPRPRAPAEQDESHWGFR